MAKFTKATREIVDIDDEIKKVTNSKKEVKKKKEVSNKKKTDKKDTTKNKKNKSIVVFFKEVRKVMSKVIWPTKKEMVKYSFATICFILFFSLFFYVIEIIVALLKAWV